jgi:hypothetical protein
LRRPEGSVLKLIIINVDYNPLELQAPLELELISCLPGPDRPDYWLGKLDKPIIRLSQNHKIPISHLVVCARWEGTQIEAKVQNLPINIAYVVDPTQITDKKISFEKCEYVAIGLAHETEGGSAPPALTKVMAGHIGQAFGFGKAE